MNGKKGNKSEKQFQLTAKQLGSLFFPFATFSHRERNISPIARANFYVF